jgi:iron complex transport system permease protein
MKASKTIVFVTLLCVCLFIIDAFCLPDFIKLWDDKANQSFIFWSFRLPKALTACIVGANLALSGFILQQMYANHLAGPYILGISSGASLAVSITLIGAHIFPVLSHGFSLSIAGMLGSMIMLSLVLLVSKRFGSGASILLFGVILGQIIGAVQGLFDFLAISADLKAFTVWGLGSFSKVIAWDAVFLICISIVSIVLAWRIMPSLSIMALGNDTAKSLGVKVPQVQWQLLCITGLLTGISTAYCGPIAFIGMAMPNLARILLPSIHFKRQLVLNCVLGASMALLSDMMSSLPIFSINLPINVCTAIIGGPFVLFVLFRKK